MEDIGFVESVEEAIWWGQKHPGVAVNLGPMFDAQAKETEEYYKKNGIGKGEW
jgi:hypothetical protein